MTETDWPHLDNAPIKEAIVNINYRLSEPFSPEIQHKFSQRFKELYPVVEELSQNSVTFDMVKRSNVTSSDFYGLKVHSADGKYIFQMLQDQLVFSRIAPYQTWELMIEEAKEVWELVLSLLQPMAVTRVATRFINEIQLPLPVENIETYIEATPRVPNGLPQLIASSFSRLVIPDPASDATLVLTQAVQSRPGVNYLPVIIDIDVFKVADFDANNVKIWQLLGKFRRLKNGAFFSTITETTKGMFK